MCTIRKKVISIAQVVVVGGGVAAFHTSPWLPRTGFTHYYFQSPQWLYVNIWSSHMRQLYYHIETIKTPM